MTGQTQLMFSFGTFLDYTTFLPLERIIIFIAITLTSTFLTLFFIFLLSQILSECLRILSTEDYAAAQYVSYS